MKRQQTLYSLSSLYYLERAAQAAAATVSGERHFDGDDRVMLLARFCEAVEKSKALIRSTQDSFRADGQTCLFSALTL